MSNTLLTNLKRTVAPAALLLCLGTPAWSGTFDDAPVISVTGDGLIIFTDSFEDTAER